MPLPITVTRDVFVAETRRGGPMAYIGWDSVEMDNVCAALVRYHAAIGAVADDRARQELIGAVFTWKQRHPNEFAKRDRISGGVAVKLCVECGLDDYRPPPSQSVLIHGAVRVLPQQRHAPRVTPLDRGLPAEMTRLAKAGSRPALDIIDLYGDDFEAQGMDINYGTDSTVGEHIVRLIESTRFDDHGRPTQIPTYVCSKHTTRVGAELTGVFNTALQAAPTLISATRNCVLTDTPLRADLTGRGITHVFVTGFDANMCVAASIFGTGTVGAGYEPGFVDFGFDVVTSRFVLTSGDRPLRAQDGGPCMGAHA
jgi:nicotinamidase-related amidase